MPGRLKVRVIAGRHLPVMDRASDLTDAFVEVKFASVTYKTDVCAKSLNPTWNSEWFKFEVDDEQLQDEPLQIRVLDHDTYSAHDAIGKVYIDVDPLLDSESTHSLSGWFPIYDTMHGIRGEILIVAKLELFADSNLYKKSCCGFKFIYGTSLPACFRIVEMHGFVNDLMVRADPEYKWIDRMRTPRASNEARQRLFSKMSGELQRRIGSKVLNMGGNAVVGYQQSFDVEGDSGVVVRGIGTAVTLTSAPERKHSLSAGSMQSVDSRSVDLTENLLTCSSVFSSLQNVSSPKETSNNVPNLLSPNLMTGKHTKLNRVDTTLSDPPFITLRSFPAGFVRRISSAVTSRSVKLLDKLAHNPEDSESREMWWGELRQEVKGHALALGCNAVIGYNEQTSMCDDVIVMSAQGTAATVDRNFRPFASNLCDEMRMFRSADGSLSDSDDGSESPNHTESRRRHSFTDATFSSPFPECFDAAIFRVPPELVDAVCPGEFPHTSPLDPNVTVPDVVLATIDPPHRVRTLGKGTLTQARFCRSKKKSQGESNAVLVSEILPFIEYELHRQLCCKLKLRGMNALFNLQTTIILGENLVVGIATGTGMLVEALPPPETSYLKNMVPQPRELAVRKSVNDYSTKCRDRFQLADSVKQEDRSVKPHAAGNSALEDDACNFKFSFGGKPTIAISIEDVDEGKDVTAMLDDNFPPLSCGQSNTNVCPGFENQCNLLQTFAVLRRVRYDDDASDAALNAGLRRACEETLASAWFRIRRTHPPPATLSSLRFHLVLPDDDQLQIWLFGCAFSHISSQRQQLTNNQRLRDSSTRCDTGGTLTSSGPHVAPMEPGAATTSSGPLVAVIDTGAPTLHESPMEPGAPTTSSGPLPAPTEAGTNRMRSVSDESQFATSLSTLFRRLRRHDSTSSSSTHRRRTASHRGRYASEASCHTPSGACQTCKNRNIATDSGTVDLYLASAPPGRNVRRHKGTLNMFVIRETTAVRGADEQLPDAEPEHGSGASWFATRALAELQAMVRAHVRAIGGNALTSFATSYCALKQNAAKNEAQCLMCVSGDVVVLTQPHVKCEFDDDQVSRSSHLA